MTYRIRNVLVAVGLALVAMMLTLFYVSNVRRSVQTDSKLVPVYVAAHDVQAGTTGTGLVSGHDLKRVEVPKSEVVPGAISSPADVDSLVVSAPLFQGEQVTLRRFSDAAAEGIRSQLRGNMRAVQVAGDPNQLLAGTLEAGDHVDLVANLRLSSTSTAAATRIVLRDLEVLTPPASSTAGHVSVSGTDAAILAVSDTQVQRLFFVLKNADWTFELRPVVNAIDDADQVATTQSVLQEGTK